MRARRSSRPTRSRESWCGRASSRRYFSIRKGSASVADAAREIFAIEEIGGWSLVQFAGWHGAIAALEQAVTAKCGIEAPRKVGGINRRGSSALIRVAPDR